MFHHVAGSLLRRAAAVDTEALLTDGNGDKIVIEVPGWGIALVAFTVILFFTLQGMVGDLYPFMFIH